MISIHLLHPPDELKTIPIIQNARLAPNEISIQSRKNQRDKAGELLLSLHILRSPDELKTIPIIQDVRLAPNEISIKEKSGRLGWLDRTQFASCIERAENNTHHTRRPNLLIKKQGKTLKKSRKSRG